MNSSKSATILGYQILVDVWNHPANSNRKVRSLYQALAWQVHKRLIRSDKRITFHGLSLHCPPSNHSASRAIYFSQYPDYREMKFIEKFLRDGDQFIDIGANIGLYSLLALSCVGPHGHVHSIEPNSTLSALLQKTKRANELKNWSIHQVAVGEHNGATTLANTGDDCTSHIDPDRKKSNSAEVEIVALQDYLPKEPYTMIKLDIEGYEPFAIRGMRDWLVQESPPVLQLELAGYSNKYGISSDQFIGELEQLGYFLAVYCPNTNRLIKTNKPWEIPSDNVLAIHSRSESFVLERISGECVAI
jgi:FkbM family methyltransferase